MKISREVLDQFKAVYKKEFGINLTDNEATEKAESLMNAKDNSQKKIESLKK